MTEKEQRVRADPIDGLPATEVGPWAREKHARLEHYIKVSRAARKGFVDLAGATFIDPYCAAGRAYIRGTDEFIDGSPLVAWKASQFGKAPFTSMWLNDREQVFAEAAGTRLRALKAPVVAMAGEAAEFVDRIVPQLNPHALHFAFVDPFSLDLPFSMIKRLATLKRMDLLIHVSAMELQRNWRSYSNRGTSPLDVFNPGWRTRVETTQSDESARQAFVHDWIAQLGKLGFDGDVHFRLITGSTNQPLYWLVMIAKHKLPNKFWKSVSQRGDTRPLF